MITYVNKTGEFYVFIESNCPKVCGKELDFPGCLRLWISGNNVANNVQFLVQTDNICTYLFNQIQKHVAHMRSAMMCLHV